MNINFVQIRGKIVGSVTLHEQQPSRSIRAEKVFYTGHSVYLLSPNGKVYYIHRWRGRHLLDENSRDAETPLEVLHAFGIISHTQFAALKVMWDDREQAHDRDEAADDVRTGLEKLGIKPDRKLKRQLDEAQGIKRRSRTVVVNRD